MCMINITGNLGKDPEIKYFETGKCKATSSIAVAGYEKKEKVTYWFNIEAWDNLAERFSEYFKKGQNVTVNGFLKKNEYKNASGETKCNYTVVANSISYSGAYGSIFGEVEKVEDRFTNSNKKVQIIKLFDNDILIYNWNEKASVIAGNSYNFYGDIAMNEYKPSLKCIKIDCAGANKKQEERDNSLVEFGEVEDTIDLEEIPF